MEFATDIENVKSVITNSIEEGGDLNKRIEELRQLYSEVSEQRKDNKELVGRTLLLRVKVYKLGSGF